MRQFLLFCGLLASACASCKGNDRPPPPDAGNADGGTKDGGAAVVDRVEVSPATLTVQVEEMQTLTVRLLDAAGNEITGRQIAWSSSDETKATVNASGGVTGVAVGTAVVSASVDQKSASAMITIVPRNTNPVASVELNETNAALLVGETIQLNATARDAGGVVVPGRPISWRSADAAIATVSNNGLVTAIAAGATQITATIDSISASATIDVTQPQVEPGDVEIDVGTTYQTMTGWEATAQMGQWECNQTAFFNYQASVIDRAVNELGINRIRLELYSGSENTLDWFGTNQVGEYRYRPVNDNNDPSSLNAAGFQWGHLDSAIDRVITPFQAALQARGERLYVSLNVVDFDSGGRTFLFRDNPAEYGELVLAAFQHIESTYGWVPDGLEVMLEPDVGGWSNSQVANAFVAAADRLEAAGYQPSYTLPSHTNMWAAIGGYDEIRSNGGAGRITELAYHRYNGVGLDAAMAVGERVRNHGVKSAMLEHIGSGLDDLMEDLTVAMNSAWQQYTIAFCPPDGVGLLGAKYYVVDTSDPNNPTIDFDPLARYFPQFFRQVRMGAVRHGLTIRDASLAPLAFQNTDGRWVVIVRTQGSKSLKVGRLPPGTYGVYYTTEGAMMVDAGDVTIAAGEAVDVSIPAAGVVTIYRR